MTQPRAFLLSPPFVLVATAALALVALPRSSRANEPDPHRCYSTAPVWNAKKGVIVSGVSPGPIAAVLGGVGETRTHSMISNGDWATHSTSLAPSIRYLDVYALGIKVGSVPDPNKPLKPNELAAGSPGFSQINMGGAYAYWQGASQVWTQVVPPILAEGLNPAICSSRCKAEGTADWLWSSIPYQASGTMYLLGFNDQSGVLHRMSYGFHQYMNGIDKIAGIGNEDWGGRGIVCSEVAPYAYANWVPAANPRITAGTGAVNYQTYSHSETANAGSALWHSIFNQCMGTDNGFWIDTFGGGLELAICTSAAYQVLNCFLQGETSNSSGCSNVSASAWNAYVPNTGATGARSLSPEGLMGLNGKPSSGPWAKWTQGALQWNGAGSTYGCYW